MKKNKNIKTINHEQIAIFSYGRKNSQRCHNKLLRNFHKTTVVDILLSKLGKYKNSYFGGYEKEFKEKCNKHDVNFVQRTKRSVNIDYPISEAISFVREIEQDYLLLVNACLPFLSVETINLFLKEVIKSNFKPTSLLVRRNNYFFDTKHKPINFKTSVKTLNTKKIKPVFEFGNALYFFNKQYFLKNKKYWDWNTVRYVTVDNQIELLDIDTENDFLITESLWKNLYG